MFDNLKYLLGVPKGSAPGCLVGRDLPGGPDWMGDFVRALVGFGDSLGVCVGVELPLLLGLPFFLELCKRRIEYYNLKIAQ